MNIIRLTMHLGFMTLGVFCFGQSDILSKNISIRCEGLPLKEVIDQIEKELSVSFSYSSTGIPIQQRIKVHVKDKELREALDEVFFGLPIKYAVVEGKIILTKSDPGSIEKHTISGYLKDSKNGETLIGATVLVSEIQKGTISNPYGFYSLTLPEGRYTLKFSYIGYIAVEKSITLDQSLPQSVSLDPDFSVLDEIVVAPDDSVRAVENIHSNITVIDQNTILDKPAPLGEPDMIKSLDVIPGVQLFRDGSTFFNVRGGDRDQNQLLVDEAPIYNSAHLLGLFSSFMPEAIKDVKLYKGNAPADFGGRISSVMDIRTKDGNMKKFGMNGRLGFVSTRLSVEGPLKKDRSSYFLSARRSHIGSLLSAVGLDFDELYFSDFTAKANLKIGQKDRLFISTFLSKDEYLDNGGLRWENNAGTIRWNHVFNDRLFSNTTLYTSRYEYNLIASENIIWKNHISNASLKTDFTFFKNPESAMKFGFKLSGHNFNPGNLEDFQGNGFDFVPKRNTSSLSLYFSHDKQLGKKWLMNYGFRLSSWTNFGRTIEYEINKNYEVVDSTIYNTRSTYNDFANLQPRFSLTWLAGSNDFLKFNYSRSVQYLNLISNSISPFNNLEVWLPASINIKPQLADQLSLGWIHDREKWRFQLEGYSKAMQNQLDYSNQAKLLLNPHMEAELRSGDGRSYGLEVTVNKKSGKLSGWISYVYSRSFRKIRDINNDEEFPTLWDKPHQLSSTLSYKRSERSTFSGTFVISSGAPITTPTSFYEYSGRTVPIYSKKNNSRLPTYHRFDISWQYRLNRHKKNFNHFLAISIFNFYGQKNTIMESFNKVEMDNGTYRVPTKANNKMLIPTYRFVYGVVPSITYSFYL